MNGWLKVTCFEDHAAHAVCSMLIGFKAGFRYEALLGDHHVEVLASDMSKVELDTLRAMDDAWQDIEIDWGEPS